MTCELVCVNPAQVFEIWPYVSLGLEKAMQRGGMGHFESLERDVLTNNAYLWLARENNRLMATAVTKVTTEPDHRLCTLLACAGHDYDKWGALIEGLEKYAKAEGCQRMEICGRPGWVKKLPGYRLVKVVLRKDL